MKASLTDNGSQKAKFIKRNKIAIGLKNIKILENIFFNSTKKV
ncbi:hypothetical protein CAMRE0001_2681 [Campylobacter rectus RM3267]|uniref:Uncharacterized protein n=1 Tax=Campylobacter rectus RM3267 TaxID=553218 RepID=B9D3Y8_CAMRE|nr:hypothetical protein CAMRE0001_2681 [Campylobacter rectus RM3267]